MGLKVADLARFWVGGFTTFTQTFILRSLTLLFLILFVSRGNAQEVEIHYQRGFLLAHRASMQHLVKAPSNAVLVQWENTLTWGPLAESYNSPGYGVAFYSVDVGNRDEIGFAAGIYPYVNLHFLKTPKIVWDTQVGWGVGWVQKTYNRVDNFRNIAVGTHINLVVGLRTDVTLQLSQKLRTTLGVGFTHFSNGAFQMPNLGLNIPSLNVGLAYHFSPEKEEEKNYYTTHFFTSGWSFSGLFGAREVEPNSASLFPSANPQASYFKVFTNKAAASITYDAMWKPSIQERAKIDTAFTGIPSAFQSGFMVSYHQLFYPIDMYLGIGLYVFDQFSKDNLFYHRLGMRYHLKNHFFFNFNVFSHYAKADQFQIGLGYRL